MKAPLTFLPLSKLLRNPFYYTICKKEYLAACRFFGCTLIDRTQTLDIGRLQFEVLDPLSELKKTELRFEEIAILRAKHLLKIAQETDKKICVLWSGGIDSTVALVALIKVAQEESKLESIEVLLSKESIEEFPNFFKEIIQKNINYTLYEPPLYPLLENKTKIFITGEHGDQLFGSDKAKYYVLSEDAFKPYSEILPFMIGRKLGTEKYTQKMIDFLAPQISKSPVPIHTLYDYLWWMNFSQKWQHVSLRLISKSENIELGKDMIHFFSNSEFQSWSISNHHLKIDRAWNTYKQVGKTFINDFFEDEEYYLYKEKEPSLKDAIVEKKQNYFLSIFK
ncbi:hypothetical protein [Bernardetia sp.]|uniref:hypothetical protein n=1 Tax=Bernardetia sp. TaxID=1937974 RepID=UPI0025C018ED|nr:hypothetical protein [Bernardetia sp.]